MSEIIIYEPEDGGQVTVRLDGDSLWLTQEQMSELFGRERSVITKHLRNVFREEELEESSVCVNFARTAGDGQPVINDIGLAALALLVAESAPAQKETMIRLIENMLAGVQ